MQVPFIDSDTDAKKFSQFLELFAPFYQWMRLDCHLPAVELLPSYKNTSFVLERYLQELQLGLKFNFQPMMIVPSFELLDMLCSNVKLISAQKSLDLMQDNKLGCTPEQYQEYLNHKAKVLAPFTDKSSDAFVRLQAHNEILWKERFDSHIQELEDNHKLPNIKNMPWDIRHFAGGVKSNYFLGCINPEDLSTIPLLLIRCPINALPVPCDTLYLFPFGGYNQVPSSDLLRTSTFEWYQTCHAMPALMTAHSLDFFIPEPNLDEKTALRFAQGLYSLDHELLDSRQINNLGQLASMISKSRCWFLWWNP